MEIAAAGQPDFRPALHETLVFWLRCVDSRYGGYLVELDETGKTGGSGDKHLVALSRMIYAFSAGYRFEADSRYREAARQGVAFLKTHFYDEEYGGFFLLTDRKGRVKDRCKWPYGIAFALYALSEYSRCCGEPTVLDLAVETYDLWQQRAWDQEFGGFFENLDQRWQPLSRIKRAGHMLHGMEAASALFAATGDCRYRQFLYQLAETLTDRFFDARSGCLHEHFTVDWQPYTALSGGQVLYGHILEAAWFLAAMAGFQDDADLLTISRTLLKTVLDHAWDRREGGVYMSGLPDGAAVDTGKMWWVQAAAIGALSTHWRVSDDPQERERLLASLTRQWAFIRQRVRDPRDGAWRLLVDAEYGSCGLKGHGLIDQWPIKTAYHVVQALTQAARNLETVDPHKKSWDAYCF